MSSPEELPVIKFPTTPEDFAKIGKQIGTGVLRVQFEDGTKEVILVKVSESKDVGGEDGTVEQDNTSIDQATESASRSKRCTVGYSASYATRYDEIFRKKEKGAQN